MNFLPLILGFLLLKSTFGFGKDTQNNQSKQKNDGASGLFSNIEEAQQALQLVSLFNKIKDNKADTSELLSEIMTNPLAMNFISKMGFGGQQDFGEQQTPQDAPFEETTESKSDTVGMQNDSAEKKASVSNDDFVGDLGQRNDADDTTFNVAQTPADTLFKPVENIAGVELTKKLKKYYENWYVS